MLPSGGPSCMRASRSTASATTSPSWGFYVSATFLLTITTISDCAVLVGTICSHLMCPEPLVACFCRRRHELSTILPQSCLYVALQVDLEDLICDMNYDHRADLVAHGIRELSLDGKRLVVRCLSGTSQAADLRTYLDSMLDLCNVNIEFRFVELATATALNLTGTQ